MLAGPGARRGTGQQVSGAFQPATSGRRPTPNARHHLLPDRQAGIVRVIRQGGRTHPRRIGRLSPGSPRLSLQPGAGVRWLRGGLSRGVAMGSRRAIPSSLSRAPGGAGERPTRSPRICLGPRGELPSHGPARHRPRGRPGRTGVVRSGDRGPSAGSAAGSEARGQPGPPQGAWQPRPRPGPPGSRCRSGRRVGARDRTDRQRFPRPGPLSCGPRPIPRSDGPLHRGCGRGRRGRRLRTSLG